MPNNCSLTQSVLGGHKPALPSERQAIFLGKSHPPVQEREMENFLIPESKCQRLGKDSDVLKINTWHGKKNEGVGKDGVGVVGQGEAEMRCQDRQRKRQKGRDRDTEGVAGSVRPQDPSSSWDKRFRHPLSILGEQRIFLLWDMGLLSRVWAGRCLQSSRESRCCKHLQVLYASQPVPRAQLSSS